MGLLDRFKGHSSDGGARPGFVFGIGVDGDSLSEAIAAGKKDGDDWVPGRVRTPPFIEVIRARVLSGMHDRQKACALVCQDYAGKARQLLDGQGNLKALRRQVTDFDDIVDRFDDDCETALTYLHQLEEVWSRTAAPRLRKRHMAWSIPEFEQPTFLTEERQELEELKNELKARQQGNSGGGPVDDR